MGEVHSIIDRFSGMITREQAESILRKRDSGDNIERLILGSDASANASELLDLALRKEIRSVIPSLNVNIRDAVYRVFNDTAVYTAKGITNRRKVAIGSEGRTVIIEMMGRQSDAIDRERIERGNRIYITNTIFNLYNGKLYTTTSSKISNESVSESRYISIDDINRDLNAKNLDVIGVVADLANYVTARNSMKEAYSSCTLKGHTNSAKLHMWGSSAILSKRISDGDTIKVEFCTVSNTDGQISVNAWDSSRILVLKRGR